MPLTKLKDDAGDTIDVYEVDGFYYPTFPVPNIEQEMKAMHTWKARDDDVLLCAYPRSGIHWLLEMVYMLVNKKEQITQIVQPASLMENLHQERFDAMESPRLLNSHLYPRHLPQDFFHRKCKLVLLFRNPKDVAVSFFNHHYNLSGFYHYNGSWANYLPRFIEGNVNYGTYLDYAEVWEKFMKENPLCPVHLMYYEEMMKDSLGELTKLARFLEVNLDPHCLATINKECCFDNMKKEKEKFIPLHLFRDGKSETYRKGKVGDWKHWFTVAQNELFDEKITEKLKNLNFKMIFEI